nr:basic proline-rich protein-like [Chrysemys picta bellii]
MRRSSPASAEGWAGVRRGVCVWGGGSLSPVCAPRLRPSLRPCSLLPCIPPPCVRAPWIRTPSSRAPWIRTLSPPRAPDPDPVPSLSPDPDTFSLRAPRIQTPSSPCGPDRDPFAPAARIRTLSPSVRPGSGPLPLRAPQIRTLSPSVRPGSGDFLPPCAPDPDPFPSLRPGSGDFLPPCAPDPDPFPSVRLGPIPSQLRAGADSPVQGSGSSAESWAAARQRRGGAGAARGAPSGAAQPCDINNIIWASRDIPARGQRCCPAQIVPLPPGEGGGRRRPPRNAAQRAPRPAPAAGTRRCPAAAPGPAGPHQGSATPSAAEPDRHIPTLAVRLLN